MKRVLPLVGMIALVLLLISCVPETVQTPSDSERTSPTSTMTDDQLLQQYPAGLDEALEELETFD